MLTQNHTAGARSTSSTLSTSNAHKKVQPSFLVNSKVPHLTGAMLFQSNNDSSTRESTITRATKANHVGKKLGAEPISGHRGGMQEHSGEQMRKLMVKDRLLVTAVGAVTPEELAPMIDEVIAELPETSELPETPDIVLPELEPADPIIVDLPQPQSLVQLPRIDWVQVGTNI